MILFRCDADSSLGLGHLMRCRTLAAKLAELNQSCIMVGPAEIYIKDDDQRIFKEWIPMPWQNTSVSDASALAATALAGQATGLVLDDMRIDDAYQIELRKLGVKWLQFDDEAKKPIWSDLVVNANPVVTTKDYASLIQNKNAEILIGPRYALLREEFSTVQRPSHGSKSKTILLTFGGGDDRGAIQFSLETLLPLFGNELRFIVIASRNNPRNDANIRWIHQAASGRVDYRIDSPNIASIMAQCDLAVMAGGTTTYEANCMGLPMVIIAIAENQIPQSQAWEQMGQAVFLGEFERLSSEVLCKAVIEQISRAENGVVSTKLVDGRGSQRIAEKMLNCFY